MSRKLDIIKKIAEYTSKTAKFERHIKDAKYLSMNEGNCKAEFMITEDHLNTEGNLHTGMMMTIVDVISSWALLSYENGYSGVSSNIHLSHIKPAVPGEVLSIDARLCQVTYPLAFLEVELSRKNSEDIVARGQHTLFIKPLTYKI